MRGINQQITLSTATNIDVTRLKMITNLVIFNETNAPLYVLVDVPDGATPGPTHAHFVVQNAKDKEFNFDNVSQAPKKFRVLTGATGYVHLVGW